MTKGPGQSRASKHDSGGNRVTTGGVVAALMAPGTKAVPDDANYATTTLTPAQECLKERYWSYFLHQGNCMDFQICYPFDFCS